MASLSTMERPLAANFDPPDRLLGNINFTEISPFTMARLSSLPSLTYHSLSRLSPSSQSLPPNLTTSRLIEMIVIISLHALLIIHHVRPTVPHYNKHQRSPQRRLLANTILAVHVAGGIIEMLRWQFRACWNPLPVPDNLDLFLALLQAVTSLRLAKYMRRGQPLMTRPTFQAGPVFRFGLSALAWYWMDGRLHKGSVKTLDGFLWVRAAVAFLGPLVVSKHGERPKFPEVYNLATFAGVVIAVSDVEIPHATKIYAALVVAVAALNRWVTSEFERKDIWAVKKVLLHTLASCGFAELETIKLIAASAASAPTDDRFVPEVLRVQETTESSKNK